MTPNKLLIIGDITPTQCSKYQIVHTKNITDAANYISNMGTPDFFLFAPNLDIVPDPFRDGHLDKISEMYKNIYLSGGTALLVSNPYCDLNAVNKYKVVTGCVDILDKNRLDSDITPILDSMNGRYMNNNEQLSIDSRSPEDVEKLLRQVFSDLKLIQLSKEEKLSGYSGAEFYRVYVVGYEHNNFHCFLKFSVRKEKIINERNNYAKYVKNQIEFGKNAILDETRFGMTEKYAGLVYNFVEASDLFSYIQQHSTDEIINIIRQTFKSMKCWRSFIKIDPNGEDIIRVLNNHNFFINSPIEKLNEKIPALKDEKVVVIKIPEIDEFLIHPRFYFGNLKKAEAKFPLPFSICHGDLHAKNILVNKDTKESWLIDFSYTGYAYTFIDHATLENSIKFDVLGFCPLNHFYILEKNLMEQTAYSTKTTPSTELEKLGNKELLKIFEIVKTIREDAAQIRNYYGNFDDFYYALLYLSLFYLTFTDKNPNNYLRALISSSLLYKHLFRQEFSRLKDEKPFTLDITNSKANKDDD